MEIPDISHLCSHSLWSLVTSQERNQFTSHWPAVRADTFLMITEIRKGYRKKQLISGYLYFNTKKF